MSYTPDNAMMKLLTFAALFLAASSAFAQPPGQSWALLIGVAKFQNLPHDLWLQYPDADAKTLAKFLESARGGSVTSDHLDLITDEQATTANLRNALSTFLKKPGKEDTVYIFVASHGLADSRGAYILTYDSDTQNLGGTALPMAELHSIVEEEATRAGHVVFLADVCHASSTQGQPSESLNGALTALSETQGEMLGLMAARPKEVSFEGPEFGGGHGAFTWAVLQGLSGDADENKDGFVSAGELIDFVSDDVSRLTKRKQHARDFGNMDGAAKLADLSKPGIELPKS
jgi:uncharacterized caspase-like protein